ncbi:MAG: hypothetical protein ACK5QL_02805, partial [Microcystis sp.]
MRIVRLRRSKTGKRKRSLVREVYNLRFVRDHDKAELIVPLVQGNELISKRDVSRFQIGDRIDNC